MKDGSRISGYVFWQSFGNKLAFEPKKFLERQLKHTGDHTEFELIRNLYSINDKGFVGGIAYIKKDFVKVRADLVLKITSTPDKYENKQASCEIPELTIEQITLMQNKCYYADSIPSTDGMAQIWLFSYDPKIGEKKLHELLLDLQRTENNLEVEKLMKKTKHQKVVMLGIGCD